MTESGVPATVQEVWERYDRLIYRAIHVTLRRSPEPDEVEELRQAVYVRLLENNFLGRSHAHCAAYGGQFSTGLWCLVRNLTLNYLERRATRLRMTEPVDDDDRRSLSYDDAAIRGLDAGRFLDTLAGRCPRVPARIILHHAREHGLHSGTLSACTGIPASRIRHYLVAIRAAARRLREEELTCTLVNTTKSVPSPSVAKAN